MKLKASWAVFIPTLLSVVGVQIYQSVSQSDTFTTSLIAVIITALMLGILTLIACADKYTVNDYPPKKNIFSGAMLILTGVFTAAYGITGLSAVFEDKITTMQIVSIAVSLLSAIIFMLLGINVVTGNFTVTAAPLLTLAPTVFFVIELIKRFIAYTTEAVRSTEMYDLLYVIFLLIFFYYCASIYAGIPTKYAVKCCFIFGMAGVVLTLAWCVKDFYPLLTGSEEFVLASFLPEFIALSSSAFIVSFLLEISLKADVINYFATDGDEDYSEEEELFGISGRKIKNQTKSTHSSPYQNMTRYGKKAVSTESQASPDKSEEIIYSGSAQQSDTENEHTQSNNIEKIVSDFESSKPSSVKSDEKQEMQEQQDDQKYAEDDDMSWIDRLIKDIEEEQNKQ